MEEKEQATTEQKVLAAIGEASQLSANIAASFGHTTAASAIAEYSTLAPVFAGIVDTIRGLFAHHKANQPVKVQASAATA